MATGVRVSGGARASLSACTSPSRTASAWPTLPFQKMRRRALPGGRSDGMCGGWARCVCRGTRIIVVAAPRGERRNPASGDPAGAGGGV